jgi:hypothetical protein
MVATVELLRKEAGELIVKTTVAGAEVLLNRQKVGTTDKAGMLHLHDLPLGKIRVEVKHPNQRAAIASEVQIMKGEPARLEVELPAATAGLKSWFKGLTG